MHLENLNFLAVIVAALSTFLIGGLWYSPILFGKTWMREAGISENDQQGHPAKVYGLSFVFALLAAFAFAILLGHHTELAYALHYALLVGIGFVATSFGINYQFSNKSIKLWLIDAGYHFTQFLAIALILSAWPK
ncbi:MAG: DUF1761 domain-containing protein [Gammaproteobacteria bacterium]|nr:DUF1761 domain-containing protein [Gammaproteobacteria bacterium]